MTDTQTGLAGQPSVIDTRPAMTIRRQCTSCIFNPSHLSIASTPPALVSLQDCGHCSLICSLVCRSRASCAVNFLLGPIDSIPSIGDLNS